MAVTLITDLASEVANSYCDADFADAYWANDYRTAKVALWTALTADQKAKLLVRACAVIETMRFVIPYSLPEYALHYNRRTRTILDMNLSRDPVKYFYYQKLQFPRNLDVYFQNPPAGSVLGDLYIPEDIKNAQCEQAGYLLSFDESQLASRMQGVSMEKTSIGKGQVDVTVEYAGGLGTTMSPVALDYCRPYLVRGGKMQRA